MSTKLPALTLAALERQRIEECLTDNEGNRTHAARDLGISVRTLQRKLKSWGILERANPGKPSRAKRRS